MRWHYWPHGEIEVDEQRLETTVAKHSRQWSDVPEAHEPSTCWTLIRRERWFEANDRLHQVDTGYIFWDARNEVESS